MKPHIASEKNVQVERIFQLYVSKRKLNNRMLC